jgi:hypothetical protein
MISIIKAGTRKKCTCSDCGCVFSYEEEDTRIVSNPLLEVGHNVYFRDPKENPNRCVKCPQCGSNQKLSTVKQECKRDT